MGMIGMSNVSRTVGKKVASGKRKPSTKKRGQKRIGLVKGRGGQPKGGKGKPKIKAGSFMVKM